MAVERSGKKAANGCVHFKALGKHLLLPLLSLKVVLHECHPNGN
jgi:hypothetical protein